MKLIVKTRFLACILLAMGFWAIMFLPQGEAVSKPLNKPQNLTLQQYNNGIFSLNMPTGWRITMAGDGSTLAFLSWDPARPLRQIFYFGAVGPLYMSEQQKQIDLNYMKNGGYSVGWIEMPVVQPFTPSSFLMQFHKIARTTVAQNFMPQCPRLDGIRLVSAKKVSSMIPGGETELIRALFVQNGQVAEGMFLATTVPFMPFMNGPGGGNGYGCLLSGIAAPKREFSTLQDDLARSIRSFTINPSYARDYMGRQEGVFREVMKAGQTLRETSDIITKGWSERQKTEDIISEKRADAIRGIERLYDPETNTVYEFENGFFEKYNLQRNRYNLSNLQPLPDNSYKLWTSPPLNGTAHLRYN